jgi:hypothetical protein
MRVEGFGDLVSQHLARDEAGSIGQLTGRFLSAEQTGGWHHYSYPLLSRTPHKPRCETRSPVRGCLDSFADRLALAVDAVQMCAEQLAGVRVNVLDLKPIGLIGWFIVVFAVGLVEDESA